MRLKKVRTLKQHREGYIDDEEFKGEMAAIALALKKMDLPEVDRVIYDEVIEAGKHIAGMTALWDVGTVSERRDMVEHLLEPEGLYYDTELKIVAALKPRPNFLPILRLLDGVVEYKETSGLLVTAHWSHRNRRATTSLSPVLTLYLPPSGELYIKLQELLAQEQFHLSTPSTPITPRRSEQKKPRRGIPSIEWPAVVRLCAVLLTTRSHYGRLRRIMVFRMRRSGVLFVPPANGRAQGKASFIC